MLAVVVFFLLTTGFVLEKCVKIPTETGCDVVMSRIYFRI